MDNASFQICEIVLDSDSRFDENVIPDELLTKYPKSEIKMYKNLPHDQHGFNRFIAGIKNGNIYFNGKEVISLSKFPESSSYIIYNEDLPDDIVNHAEYKINDLINYDNCLAETCTESSKNNIKLLRKINKDTSYGNQKLLGKESIFYNGYLSYNDDDNDKVIHDIKYVEFDGKPITNTWFAVYVYL